VLVSTEREIELLDGDFEITLLIKNSFEMIDHQASETFDL